MRSDNLLSYPDWVRLSSLFGAFMTLSVLSAELDDILQSRAITTLFQPICTSDGQTIGYEALSRGPQDSLLHTPDALFAAARQYGRLLELDMLCRHQAIQRFTAHNLLGRLFLNASPESLLSPQHPHGRTLQMLGQVQLAPSRVVIELTEHSPINDFQLLRRALRYYRSMGFSIALDDLGAGYSGLRLWTEMMPEFIKVDRHFISNIHQDMLKQEFLNCMLRMAKASRATLVAEGVEIKEELQTLSQLGAPLVQGFLLGRPQSSWHHSIQGLQTVTHSCCG